MLLRHYAVDVASALDDQVAKKSLRVGGGVDWTAGILLLNYCGCKLPVPNSHLLAYWDLE